MTQNMSKAPITPNAFFSSENARRAALPFWVTVKKEQCAAFFLCC